MRDFIVHDVVQRHAHLWEIQLREVNDKGANLYGGDSISWFSPTRPAVFIGGIYEVGMTLVAALNDPVPDGV